LGREGKGIGRKGRGREGRETGKGEVKGNGRRGDGEREKGGGEGKGRAEREGKGTGRGIRTPSKKSGYGPTVNEQEDQLMLTNLRDAFGGQSRSPNIVPFHMLGIVSYCAILTLSLRHSIVFTIFDFKNAVTLKTELRVHQGY